MQQKKYSFLDNQWVSPSSKYTLLKAGKVFFIDFAIFVIVHTNNLENEGITKK